MMNNVKTCLIEKNPLKRAGLKSLLENSHYEISVDIPSISEIEKTNALDFQLVIYGAGKSKEDTVNAIEKLNTLSLQPYTLVISDEIDMCLFKASFVHGAHGLLLNDISKPAFIASLDLIMTGERVFAAAFINALMNETLDCLSDSDYDIEDKCLALSPRCLDIIGCLVEGYSNKEIARKLDIQEATVKAHLKAILRKLDKNNRTQVAIWALNHGKKYLENRAA